MIIDCLANAARYEALHPAFAEAFAQLRAGAWEHLAAGRHEHAGEALYVSVVREAGRGRAAARLEAHRRYIDIQYIVAGADLIGWRPTGTCGLPDGAFDANKDLGFFRDPAEVWCNLVPGSFAILFPEDAHAPMAGTEDMHKIVVKVAVRLVMAQ